MHKREISLSQKKGTSNFKKKNKNGFRQEKNPGLYFHKVLSRPIKRYDKQNSLEEVGWSQYKLWPKSKTKKVHISMNMATIHGIAKKLIAREWARVLGRPMSSRYDNLEIEAASLKNRMKKKKVKR
jgi:transposase